MKISEVVREMTKKNLDACCLRDAVEIMEAIEELKTKKSVHELAIQDLNITEQALQNNCRHQVTQTHSNDCYREPLEAISYSYTCQICGKWWKD